MRLMRSMVNAWLTPRLTRSRRSLAAAGHFLKNRSAADFEACFREFDKDGSGTIEKEEMAIFIKKVAGL